MLFKRLLVVLGLLLLLVGCAHANSVRESEGTVVPGPVVLFQPLEVDEVFAYRMEGKTLHLFGVRPGREEPRFLLSWENVVEWGGLQFSGDRKSCLFSVRTPSYSHLLHYVDGAKGTITELFETSAMFYFSYNSIYLIYTEVNLGGKRETSQTQTFVLYDLSNGEEVKRFTWTVNEDNYGGFDIRRKESGEFILFYSGEGGVVLAEAVIDPVSQSFKILWDITAEQDQSAAPNRRDDRWKDGISIQRSDPALNLGL